MNCITSSIPQSATGILVKLATEDSDKVEGSAGVVEVAASCSGGFRFGGGAIFTSQEVQSLTICSSPENILL